MYYMLTWSWICFNVTTTQEEIGCHGNQECQTQQSPNHGVATSVGIALMTTECSHEVES